MSQKALILALLRANPEGVSCQTLADNFLYHHASQRIGEMNREGWNIEFLKGDSVMSSKYILKGEGVLAQGAGKLKPSSPQVSFNPQTQQGELTGLIDGLRYD